MRKWLLLLGLVPAFAVGGVEAYRTLSRDYRYYQLVKLGDELLAEELPFQASRAFGSAIRLKPKDPIGYVKRSEAQKLQGNLMPALADLERAASLSSDVLLVSTRLAELYYELERFDDAAHHYEKLLALDPESPTVLYKLGLVHFRAGREAEAIEALNRAAAVRDGFWEAYYLRGAVFRSLGGVHEAEADLLTALRLAPEAELARSALIELYLANGQPAKALPLVEAEIDANPGASEPYLHLADVHRRAGRNLEAIEAVGLALEQNPNLPSAYLRVGELWLEEATRRDDPIARDKAVAALESAAKMDPANGRAALALGRAYLAMGDELRAFSELERASQATPAQAEAHRLLGDLYRARNNPAEAVTAYHVYLKLQGDNAAVLERLGDAYVELGRPAQAAEIYLALAAKEPRRPTPFAKAAQALLSNGDASSAVRVCRRGLTVHPENQILLSLLEQARSSPSDDRKRSSDPS